MSPALLALAGGLAALSGRTLVVAPDGPLDLPAAIAQARDGDTIEVRGGVHHGRFVIPRAVALVGVDRPILDGGGEGSVVTFQSSGGALSGFVVRGTGGRNDHEDSGLLANGTVRVEDNVFEDVLYGINLKTAPDSVVARNRIEGRDVHIARRGDAIRVWESHRTRVVDNVVRGGRDIVLWYSQSVELRGNDVRGGRYGLHFMYTHDSTIADNRLAENAVGIYMMYSGRLHLERNVMTGNHGSSGYGLALKDCDDVVVTDNVLAGNRVGLYLDNTPSARGVTNRVARNTLAWNDIGALFLPAVKGNVFEDNAFIENHQQVGLTAPGAFAGNDWTPGGAGNYWSNYAGFDADGDGIGDVPYEEVGLFDDIAMRHPALQLFAHGPAEGAIDLAARAFPVFRPAPTLVDTAPRIAPPALAFDAPERDGRALATLAALLVAGGGAVGAWGLGLGAAGRAWRRGAA